MISVFTVPQASHHLQQGPADSSKPVNRPPATEQIRLLGQVESVMTQHTAKGDDNFVLLALADGTLFRGKWPAILGESLPGLGDVIRIEISLDEVNATGKQALSAGATRHLLGKRCYPISSWQAIAAPCSLEVLDQLYGATAQAEALDRLWGIIDRLSLPCLRTWLSEVFAQSRFSVPFVQVAASHNHHHSVAGGLLLHSVECAEWVERVATITLNPREAALSIVAALLHDFGKIDTMSSSGFSQMVAHEVLTLTLLEPDLLSLQRQWPQGAHALRQMLSWSTFTERFPKLPGTLLVKMADQYSTALSARDKAFQAQPKHYFWTRLTTAHSTHIFNRIN
ncbi:MAG: TraI domain-containing protein [Methylococcaceae bacterium]|nr:TraI domain-containing protein [Methylococcaceae bacterium]MDZ4219084.1 TraI domain-containing protein [Methylobacter sp.]MDP2394680.1 TraI domain-containing protein [Methylococcaceae bacterium]MDP3019167.1 TraI domain-containing protein [Methylococcaceae bacterium]MDP3389659.1 TraI domain-containing protein [Methylococcaceae bacterium]